MSLDVYERNILKVIYKSKQNCKITRRYLDNAVCDMPIKSGSFFSFSKYNKFLNRLIKKDIIKASYPKDTGECDCTYKFITSTLGMISDEVYQNSFFKPTLKGLWLIYTKQLVF